MRPPCRRKLSLCRFIVAFLPLPTISLIMGQLHPRETYPSGATKTFKGVRYREDGVAYESLFQKIADGDVDPSGYERDLLFQDDRVACFVTMNAVNPSHILVVPRSKYIKTCEDVVDEDYDLLVHMRNTGKTILDQRLGRNTRNQPVFCFHRPPFNSIDHLHLHCINDNIPRRNIFDHVKYPSFNTPWSLTFQSTLARISWRNKNLGCDAA